jgi:hypothetical protein
VAMRHAHAQSLAARAAAVRARHLRRGPGFIDKNEPLWIEIELMVEPILPSSQDVWAILLAGVPSLFLSVIRDR